MKRVKHSVKYIQNFRKTYQVIHGNKTFQNSLLGLFETTITHMC